MNKISAIKDVFRKQLSLVAIFLTTAYCLYYVYENKWKGFDGKQWVRVIDSDGVGYYAYLPCVFMYHQFDFGKIMKSELAIRPGMTFWEFPKFTNGTQADRYFVGTAFLIMPFFLIAYFLSLLFGLDTMGGYSFPFAVSVSIAALFYAMLGLLFIRKLLKIYSIPEYIIGIVVLLVFFGTNIFYEATIGPSGSHPYSFGIAAIFIYYLKRSVDDKKLKHVLLSGILLAILTIIRPTNALNVFMLPFLAGSWSKTTEFICVVFKRSFYIPLFLVIITVLFIQSTCWKIETGNFFIYSYSDERFYFNHPHFWDILFSYNHGWFVYTPIMFLITFGGLLALWVKNKFLFVSFSLYSALFIYVLSCWWSWWFGGFENRGFIDFYPAFFLLFGLTLYSISSWLFRIPFILACSFCLFINLIEMYQFNNFILPDYGMNKEKYWKIFLKTSNLYCGIFDNPDTTKYNYIDSLTFKNDFENNPWGNDKTINSIMAHSGSHSVLLNSTNNDSPEFTIDASKIPSINNLNIYLSLWTLMSDFDNDAKALVYVKSKEGNTTLWTWKSFKGFVSEKNSWTQGYFIFQLSELKTGDKIHALINTSRGSTYIDDMEIKFCTPIYKH